MSESSLTAEQHAALRAPFPPEKIGKLPKAGVTLDYVGHADVTDRLLEVDPAWSWEPFAVDADGAPLVRERGTESVLWIRLTVCGVTRIGVGIAPTKSVELEKQLISDAIRNAAMRFGVALDLWAKHEHESRQPSRPSKPTSRAAHDGMVDARTAKIALLDAYAEVGHPDPNQAAAAAWKAARVPAGPVQQSLLDRLIDAAKDSDEF